MEKCLFFVIFFSVIVVSDLKVILKRYVYKKYSPRSAVNRNTTERKCKEENKRRTAKIKWVSETSFYRFYDWDYQ